MADKLFQAKAYVSYWLNAVDEHSLHSPFFFDLYTKVVRPKVRFGGHASIERLRTQLLQDKRVISFDDLGARGGHQSRTIADIAGTALAPVKFSGIYARLIEHANARVVFELGTSFGINTLYLSQAPQVEVRTFEGVPPVIDIAQLTFEFQASKNIQLITGNIDETLPRTLESVRKIDFALIDANHQYEATVRYFHQLLARFTEKSVMVVDDIHYSADMERAWNDVRHHKLVHASADLFRCGLLFFDPSLNKQHVILQV